MSSEFRRQLVEGIPEQLPQPAAIDRSVPRAPKRKAELSASERRLALHNALRYFPRRCTRNWSESLLKSLRPQGGSTCIAIGQAMRCMRGR